VDVRTDSYAGILQNASAPLLLGANRLKLLRLNAVPEFQGYPAAVRLEAAARRR
jgi:hypothetical protein